jgi:SAM-dependent methyltransferase
MKGKQCRRRPRKAKLLEASLTKPNYGIDSPAIIAGLLVFGALPIGVAALLFVLGSPSIWRIIGLVFGAYFLAGAGGMLWYSKVGKLRLREEMLSQIPWRGDEMVLDVGCGRGLLAVGTARRLTAGKAVGVDVWLRGALSGNGPEQVLENARREGVPGRVETKEGDARQLPFAENTFDVVVSNFVLHELKTRAEREKMVREIVRVLKPGGRLALVDFIFTGQCMLLLRDNHMNEVKRCRLGSLFSWLLTAAINFGMVQVYLVKARKPE